jgi:hypothetical protein
MMSLNKKQMTTGQILTQHQILGMGMIELNNPNFLYVRIYLLDEQVYFFEPLSENQLRLYSIINKRSFYL